MRVLVYMIIFIPVFGVCQESSGIRFEKGLSWKQIQAKAKDENKFIFLECNATWCGPCKEMDRNVFKRKEVGDFVNRRFISIKLQMDSTSIDSDDIRKQYSDANYISATYKILSLPTFLFFSPQGKLVHKAIGGKNAEQLINVASEALDSNFQYYTLVEKYKRGKVGHLMLANLARTAKILDDRKLSDEIATRYINGLSENDVFTKENISFIWEFTDKSSDKGFSLFFKHSERVNKIMGSDYYTVSKIDFIIAKEEIDPIIIPLSKSSIAGEPNWNEIMVKISKKFDAAYAKRTVNAAKIRWYAFKKNWVEYSKCLVIKLDMTNGNNLEGFSLNNDAWALFKHCEDKVKLERAIYWMEQLFSHKKEEEAISANLDTYANLLYKVGRVADAIAWEERAIELDPSNTEYREVLLKMRNSLPTWSYR